MGRIGLPEIIIVALIIIILFGARKLPEIGNALGKAIREFRKAGRDNGDESQKKPQDTSHGQNT